ncbi:MAG: NAD(P)H-hydrate dehydratase [Candidatus Lokiarchaeota archaeon]|nr:NAD(P)H-hydrate dehydratase [Candidatus Harpocratesius repetitus]
MLYLFQAVNGEEIGRFDNNAEDIGIPKILLMESAGLQAVESIIRKFSPSTDKRITVFCGNGNNGGDGFVISRHFASKGYIVDVFLCGDPIKIRTEEARLNFKILKRLILSVKIHVIRDSSQLTESLRENIEENSSLIIDALLGTGVSGKIREPTASAIRLINSLSIPKISVDIPSGMDPNTGNIDDIAVKCDFRVTFHREKTGLKNSKNKHIASIGIPREAELLVGKGDLLQCIKSKPNNAHKGQYGRLLIIGGSKSFSGAPTFAALAGVEMGLDLVKIFVPKSIDNVVRSFNANFIVLSGEDEIFTLNDLQAAKELCKWADAVVLGPGLGDNPESILFSKDLIRWLDSQAIPFVIDADAITSLASLFHDDHFRFSNKHVVITPHKGELQRLLKIPKHEIPSEFIPFINKISPLLQKFGGIFLFKGHYDIIYDAFSQDTPTNIVNFDYNHIRLNTRGTPAMTVGGTGDVLAGIVGSLLALKNDGFASAISGAYLNGRLGEEICEEIGDRISATDLIYHIRIFLKKFINTKN